MVKHDNPSLDAAFSALADPTRRAIVSRLSRGPASVSELAAPFDMSLAAISKHINVLERAGLVERTRHGRRIECTVKPQGIDSISDWLEFHKAFWTERLDALEQLLQKPDRRKP